MERGVLMVGYLGPVGGLAPVEFTTAEPENLPPRHTFRKALSGRVTAQRGPRPRRKWEVGVDWLTPSDWGVLHQMAAGAYGYQPFVWYSDTSTVTNLLTPVQSTLESGTYRGGAQGGAGTAADGTRYLRSVVMAAGDQVEFAASGGSVQGIAVPAGVPVTFSAYATSLSTEISLRVHEYDAEGAQVGSAVRTYAPAGSVGVRLVGTITTSLRTVRIRVLIEGAIMTTMPSVTLTREPTPWAQGMGCTAALLDMSGFDPKRGQFAMPEPHRVGSSSFTITEVG